MYVRVHIMLARVVLFGIDTRIYVVSDEKRCAGVAHCVYTNQR